MQTLGQRLDAAWRSPDRLALTRLAEQLARAGHPERAIYSGLEELLLDQRAAGATEDDEERIMEVMDRLTGWCLPENRIVTPPSALPTEVEIAALPRWARVAFAARCARRVLPLHKFGRPEPLLPSQPEKADWAVRLAEYAAEHAEPLPTAGDNYLQAMSSAHDLYDARDFVGYSATNAAAYAAADAGDDERPARTLFATRYAASAARPVTSIDADIRRDFDRLFRICYEHFWTDDSPVPPTVFGPLWPNGKPAGWPHIEEPPAAPQPVLEPVN